MTDREKGVATAPCPTCGTDLPVTEQPDGGLALATCSNCLKTEEPETASEAPQTRRERGTTAQSPETAADTTTATTQES